MPKPVTFNLPADLMRPIESVPSDSNEACRALIRAYAKDPEHVDWSDVQVALDHALKAFGLPSDYPQRVFDEMEVG